MLGFDNSSICSQFRPAGYSPISGQCSEISSPRTVEPRCCALQIRGEFECSVPLDEYVLHTMASEGGNPGLVDARVNLTEVRPEIFATLRKAVLAKTGVEITYASMSNPEYAKRIIFPRAIVHVGRRWHVRAWCVKRQDFRDFTMGRIRSVEPVLELFPLSIEKDEGWEKLVQLELQAHRKFRLINNK